MKSCKNCVHFIELYTEDDSMFWNCNLDLIDEDDDFSKAENCSKYDLYLSPERLAEMRDDGTGDWWPYSR